MGESIDMTPEQAHAISQTFDDLRGRNLAVTVEDTNLKGIVAAYVAGKVTKRPVLIGTDGTCSRLNPNGTITTLDD